MQELISGKLLAAEQRYRSDGSCSSNRYRLTLAGGDKLSPAPDASDTTPGQVCQGAPDTGVIPGTTSGMSDFHRVLMCVTAHYHQGQDLSSDE
jgi:hypothetical protein